MCPQSDNREMQQRGGLLATAPTACELLYPLEMVVKGREGMGWDGVAGGILQFIILRQLARKCYRLFDCGLFKNGRDKSEPQMQQPFLVVGTGCRHER